ncbi:sulfatase family protein [gut metagenome]|uniref:Sulfatase family protein n=1 Tax=gut metagenome TaxID=749906 RepID=J9GNW3_9ZZZZ
MKLKVNTLFPPSLWTRQTILFAGSLFAKFLLFNLIWCMQTTFTSFSFVGLYLNMALAALIFLAPYAIGRQKGLQYGILFLLDAFLIANLMYSRTYYAAIPLDSYGIASNLSDFTASVYDSLRWIDLLFPLSSLACLYASRKNRQSAGFPSRKAYLATTGVVCGLTLGLNTLHGGFKNAYASLQNANYHTCGVPIYTLFGHLYYQALQEKDLFTPEIGQQIEQWKAQQPSYQPLPDSVPIRTNLVVILCESLESWVLERTVDGHEITPCLNALLKEPTTLYAPQVLTQVAGGRSIDGQLLLNAGMLPIQSGSYSMKYPQNTYFTLTKALKEERGARSYLLTVDKPIVWNQGVIAKAFGIDTVLSKSSWVLDEKVGSRKKLGDESFFRQTTEKLRKGEIWPEGEPAYIQCVTYSGHGPFILPDELKRITIAGDYPQRMKDYLVMANYTDHAIQQLINYLKTRSDYDQTLIVITGDHEGLASDRVPLTQSASGKGIVSDKPFTPFIVVNSPISMRYEKVMGQVDMYTTLLNLLRLDNYPWKGLGQSILDPTKPAFAISPQLQLEGSTEGIATDIIQHAEKAYTISDWMIRFDYLKPKKDLPK